MTQKMLMTLAVALAICGVSSASASGGQPQTTPVPTSPEDYRDWAQKVLLASLKDPESARVEFPTAPYRMVCKKGVFHNPTPVEIWMIDVMVNAKNSYGGYVGFEGWSVAMIPQEGGLVTWQAYTRPGGGAVTEYKLCKRQDK